MYWADSGMDLIGAEPRRLERGSLLDTTTILAPSNVYGMTIDVPGGKLYWIESLNKTLYRANLDGSMVVPVASGGFF